MEELELIRFELSNSGKPLSPDEAYKGTEELKTRTRGMFGLLRRAGDVLGNLDGLRVDYDFGSEVTVARVYVPKVQIFRGEKNDTNRREI